MGHSSSSLMVMTAVVVASAWACGGRTEILRDPRIPFAVDPADGGIGDAPLPADAAVSDASPSDAPTLDTGGCTNPQIAAQPLATPEPGDFFLPFRAVMDQTHFYLQQNDGRNRQIVRQRISGGEEEALGLPSRSTVVDAHSGRVLVNFMGANRNNVAVWSAEGLLGFDDGVSVRTQELVDSHLLSSQLAAWRVRDRLSVATFDGNRVMNADNVVLGPEVRDDAVYWVEQDRGVELKSARGLLRNTLGVGLPSLPEWMSAGATEVAFVSNGSPFIWTAGSDEVDEVSAVVGDCFASVSSRTQHVFLCSEEPYNTTELYLESGRRGAAIPGMDRGVVGAMDFDGRFLAYVLFAPGEMFCPGESEGTVNVFDTVTQQSHLVGSMTAPCLCCDRISHFPRVQVFGDTVMWTGERSTAIEFGAVRMVEKCDP